MRIKFTADYRGPMGTFTVGEERDFPRKMVERLPADSYEVLDEPEPDPVPHKKNNVREVRRQPYKWLIHD